MDLLDPVSSFHHQCISVNDLNDLPGEFLGFDGDGHTLRWLVVLPDAEVLFFGLSGGRKGEKLSSYSSHLLMSSRALRYDW